MKKLFIIGVLTSNLFFSVKSLASFEVCMDYSSIKAAQTGATVMVWTDGDKSNMDGFSGITEMNICHRFSFPIQYKALMFRLELQFPGKTKQTIVGSPGKTCSAFGFHREMYQSSVMESAVVNLVSDPVLLDKTQSYTFKIAQDGNQYTLDCYTQ